MLAIATGETLTSDLAGFGYHLPCQAVKKYSSVTQLEFFENMSWINTSRTWWLLLHPRLLLQSRLSGGFQLTWKNVRAQSKYSRKWWLSTFCLMSSIAMKTALGGKWLGKSWPLPNRAPGSATDREMSWQIVLDWPDRNWSSQNQSGHDHTFLYLKWNSETIWVWSAQKIRFCLPVESWEWVGEINEFDYFSAFSSTIPCYELFMAAVYGTADICRCRFHYMQMWKPLLQTLHETFFIMWKSECIIDSVPVKPALTWPIITRICSSLITFSVHHTHCISLQYEL